MEFWRLARLISWLRHELFLFHFTLLTCITSNQMDYFCIVISDMINFFPSHFAMSWFVRFLYSFASFFLLLLMKNGIRRNILCDFVLILDWWLVRHTHICHDIVNRLKLVIGNISTIHTHNNNNNTKPPTQGPYNFEIKSNDEKWKLFK